MNYMKQTIGILALQGAFSKHQQMVESLGYPTLLVKKLEHLEQIDKLIIPGGESSVLVILLHKHNLWDALIEFGQTKAIFGTCAGSILLSTTVLPEGNQSLGLIDMTISRNSYGRQIDSFETSLVINIPATPITVNAFFIRAPLIKEVHSSKVSILAMHQNAPVLVQQGHLLASTFHPELTLDSSIHKYFLTSF